MSRRRAAIRLHLGVPVAEDRIRAFVHAYGPDGEWVRLLEKAEGYVGTQLYRDAESPSRFVTTDLWTSKQARATFRHRFATEYETLDRRCEELTTKERFVGDFEIMDSEEAAPR